MRFDDRRLYGQTLINMVDIDYVGFVDTQELIDGK
jgi:hypothetical protein